MILHSQTATESQQVTRVILENIPGWLSTGFYVAVFAAIGWAAIGFYRRAVRRRKARREPAESNAQSRGIGAMSMSALKYLTFHRQLLEDRFAGIAHLLMFYGFCSLFMGTCLVFLEHDTPLHFFYGTFYLISSLVVDLGGVAFLIGIGMFLWRRHRARPNRLLQTWWVAVMSWLLAAIGLTGFVLEGARIARDFPPFERWSPVGYGVALGLNAVGVAGESAATLHRLTWGLHATLCVVFFALVPWKFFSHATYGLASWATRRCRPLAQLAPVTLEPTRSPGVTSAMDFLRRDLLQADACTTSGRCNEACPANAAGKPLRPRDVVLGLRAALDADPSAPLDTRIADDTLWSCTTCAACNSVCPVGIDIYDKIVDLRRGRIENGAAPRMAEELFESVAMRFNPFGKPPSERFSWASDLHLPIAKTNESIDLLYWIGCAGHFDPEGREISRAMVKILNHAKIDYRVLGQTERCTGDPARRMGEEGLFQTLATTNRSTIRGHRVKRILTHCPHCFNTMRNEYPTLSTNGDGAEPAYDVVHHTQFLEELIGAGKLSLGSRGSDLLTFHDPCYLGRGNDVVAAPRDTLAAIPGAQLTEMPRHGRSSFCCGAGGGAMWLDVRGRERVEDLRFHEAESTGAKTIATGCPFCKTMLDSSRQAATKGNKPTSVSRVKDVAELVAENLGL
jgi:Fe-S oxidoreductase/nitrate reductase gamma subunit